MEIPIQKAPFALKPREISLRKGELSKILEV